MPLIYETLANSSYLDFTGYRAGAAIPKAIGDATFMMNVALVLDRQEDPGALLAADWATRQRMLEQMERDGTLWDRFGADRQSFDSLVDALEGMSIKVLGTPTAQVPVPADGYLSSAESRTVWVQLDAANWRALFGDDARLRVGDLPQGGHRQTLFWDGDLALPAGWATTYGIRGLWFDETERFLQPLPNPGPEPGVTLPLGHQSIGNRSQARQTLLPSDIAAEAYNFPLQGVLRDPASGNAVATGSIGLIEQGIGAALAGESFQDALDAYRRAAGIQTPGSYVEIAPGGSSTIAGANPDPDKSWAAERALDVGVVTAINPQSRLLIYAGSGLAEGAEYNPYTAFQQAFWDDANRPPVITSSFGFSGLNTPDSPFYWAADQLFTDAALRNIAVFYFAGDGGSGNQIANGLTNIRGNQTGPYVTVVGGTSVSTLAAAQGDEDLQTLVTAALAGDRATMWRLVAGGLTFAPATDADATGTFVETVWNNYLVLLGADGVTYVTDPANRTLPITTGGYFSNNTGSGSVDPSRPTPSYQRDYGLRPVTADPDRLPGRGVPDLAALAGGNMDYIIPDAAMTGLTTADGTSASTPLMAALASQIDAIFADQGLPRLGYHNDLYYIAAAILPGAFNDITLGNNIASFQLANFADPTYRSDGTQILPTGYGYAAEPGYDLTTGLGSPNGVLLARALSAIAHQQWSHAERTDVVGRDTLGRWFSGADQSLLVQAVLPVAEVVSLRVGAEHDSLAFPAAGDFAWTPRLATQVLQPDFSPDLVRLFDGDAQGGLAQRLVGEGDALAIALGGNAAEAFRVALTAPFGFADFADPAGSGVVRLAWPVAEALTPGGADDMEAVVRLRQTGTLPGSVLFYRVDDLAGTIDGIAPGASGYAAASLARAYATTQGETWLAGPGYGAFRQARLADVDAGDLIAMRFSNGAQQFWAFAQANDAAPDGNPTGHLWHYALNTWGWEDMPGGGDRDFNDLVVQIDFTSAAGHGWLA